jgi:hypothetical protein
VHSGYDCPAHVVHVENGRESVEAGGVKLVAVHHRDVSKRFEISLENKE